MFKTAPRLLAATVLALVTAGASGQAVEVEGIKLDATTQVGSAALQLNGAGVRTRLFFKVYVAGLYVPQKSTSAATLLAQTGPRRVAITMLRDVDAETFAGALTDGLAANHSAAQLAGWKPQVAALKAAMQAAGGARKGDPIHFDFIPGSAIIPFGRKESRNGPNCH